MATYTKNYNLKKPAATDFVDVQDLNDNAELIDAALKTKADLTSGKIPDEQLPPLLRPRIIVYAANNLSIKATCSSDTVTAQAQAGKAQLDLPYYGTWQITGGTKSISVNVDETKVYKIALTTLPQTNWDIIADVASGGLASLCWNIGDGKVMRFETAYQSIDTLEVIILDFDHDEMPNGKRAGITFGFYYLLPAATYQNADNENNYLSYFPVELTPFLKTVIKTTHYTAGSGGYDRPDEKKLFLFSAWEALKDTGPSAAVEGRYYPGMKNTLEKCLAPDSAAPQDWWLRSRVSGSNAVYIAGDRTPNSASMSSTKCVCLGFCL